MNETTASHPTPDSFGMPQTPFQISIHEISGMALIGFMNIFAVAGGIGGGGIMIPFLMIFMQMPI